MSADPVFPPCCGYEIVVTTRWPNPSGTVLAVPIADATTLVTFSSAGSVLAIPDCAAGPRQDDTADEPASLAACDAWLTDPKIWTCDPTSCPAPELRKFDDIATAAGFGAFGCCARQELRADRTTFLP